MEIKLNYVVGFAFSRNKKDIVLIEKEKPEWQKGKFNGVGGKIEEGENPTAAMNREFLEETGVTMPYWEQYAVLNFRNITLHCFRCFSNAIYQCATVESEKIHKLSVELVLHSGVVPVIENLRVLIPMALDEEFKFANIESQLKGNG